MNTIAQTFTTTDGKTFNTRKDANAHQAFLVREAKVHAVIQAAKEAGQIAEDTPVSVVIAKLADELVPALNNPLERGRKAPAA